MKNLFALLVAIVALPVMAQYDNTDQLFSAYSGREGYRTVVMGHKMIAMMQKESGSESGPADGIRQIRILSTESSDSSLVAAAEMIALRDYELISVTNENKESTSFYICEQDSADKRLLMIARRENEDVIMEIAGDFRITDISKLSKLGSHRKQ